MTLDEKVWESLTNVIDPELGVNFVDLGLIYLVQVSTTNDVHITYSLTTIGCPIGPLIEMQIKDFVSKIEGVGEVTSEYVMRPQWTPEMLTDEGKMQMGYFQ